MNNTNVNEIIPNIDEWKPEPEDIIFTNSKNIIIAPIARFFHQDESNPEMQKLNYFIVKTKKSYNSDDLRDHNNHYLNYFEKGKNSNSYYNRNSMLYIGTYYIHAIQNCISNRHYINR